jgi:hypothetical protein
MLSLGGGLETTYHIYMLVKLISRITMSIHCLKLQYHSCSSYGIHSHPFTASLTLQSLSLFTSFGKQVLRHLLPPHGFFFFFHSYILQIINFPSHCVP